MKDRDLCRKHGITASTFYKWRAKYGVRKLSEVRLLSWLERENRRIKLLVAEITLRNQALKLVVSKKW